MTTRELLQQALRVIDEERYIPRAKIIDDIRAHLAKPEPEPVAQVIGEPISDPCGDQQVWLIQVHSHLPLAEDIDRIAQKAISLPQDTSALGALHARIAELEATIKNHGIPVKTYAGGEAHYCTKEEA